MIIFLTLLRMLLEVEDKVKWLLQLFRMRVKHQKSLFTRKMTPLLNIREKIKLVN
jgi:hypothetical protein